MTRKELLCLMAAIIFSDRECPDEFQALESAKRICKKADKQDDSGDIAFVDID